MVKVKTKNCICIRCNYVWKRRKAEVNTCPKCKSPYWNLPRGMLKQGRPKKDKLKMVKITVRDI